MRQTSQNDPRTHEIIGAAMEVHKVLGAGFLEIVYQEALSIEFANRNIQFKKEVDLPVYYKGVKLSTSYRADFLCYEGVIVELKALSELGGKEESQIINYLKATGLETGLLINFGASSLDFKRFIFNKKNP
jgi:GxxExxY protein